MTLYISLPVLASACSVVMIAHFVMLAEGRIQEDSLYGDMWIYIALAESLDFFGSDHYSFRVLGPLVSGSIAALFHITGDDSLGLLTGSLNFLYLLTGFGWMYYLSMKERENNSFEVALPAFLILTLPGFWQGVFLPVPDALMFCMFALILTGVLRQQPILLLISLPAGLFVSEWLFLAIFLLPLADYLRGSIWNRGYVITAVAMIVYLAVPLATRIPDLHMLYHPADWVEYIREQFSERDVSMIRAFWRSFMLTLPFFAYRFYVAGWNRVTAALTIWFAAVFLTTYLISPDSANRILFMTMPLLVLWQYQPGTLRKMDIPLNRASESPEG